MIKKLTTEEQSYTQDYFREIVAALLSENGVLHGMSVSERDIGDKVYCAISPGAMVKDGVVYNIQETIFGENPNLPNQLEATSFTDELEWLQDGETFRALTGEPRLYIVEYNLDRDDPEKEAMFKLTLTPQPGEVVIAFRYIPLIIRDENDPDADNFTIGDEDDNLDFYEEIA